MNDNVTLELMIRNYRAIHDATIRVGEITVLCGVNACGKSSLAHLFHSLVNFSASYDSLAQIYALQKVEDAITAVANASRRIRMSLMRPMRAGVGSDYHQFPRELWQDLGERIGGFEEKIDEILRVTDGIVSYISQDSKAFLRNRILENLISDLSLPESAGAPDVYQEVISRTDELRNIYQQLLFERNAKVYACASPEERRYFEWTGEINLKEGDLCVFDRKENPRKMSSIQEVMSLDKAIYVESPWRSIPVLRPDGRISLQDGFAMGSGTVPRDSGRDLFKVLCGEISLEEDETIRAANGSYSSQWEYRRSDGLTPINLSDCATGIKSLSILRILYSYGLLNRRTLLIVDEPEAHLHPQWVFEYAKILVALSKRIGVRLLVTTHSPDMVNAIKRVADVEDIESLRFYLANQVDEKHPFDFTYESLGRDVEKIFAKFNYAMDMIDLYPDTVEE